MAKKPTVTRKGDMIVLGDFVRVERTIQGDSWIVYTLDERGVWQEDGRHPDEQAAVNRANRHCVLTPTSKEI